MPPTVYCPRCDDPVVPIRPWPGFKVMWVAWRIAAVFVVLALPILLTEPCVMMPSTMLFFASGGAIRGYAREPSVCTVCSLEISEDAHGGTQTRLKPHARGSAAE